MSDVEKWRSDTRRLTMTLCNKCIEKDKKIVELEEQIIRMRALADRAVA